jgi:hypothetical protein
MSEPELASSRLQTSVELFVVALFPFSQERFFVACFPQLKPNVRSARARLRRGVGSDLQHMHGLTCTVPGCPVPCDLPIGREVQGPITRTAPKNVYTADSALRSPEWELGAKPREVRAHRAEHEQTEQRKDLCSCSLGLFAGRVNAAKRPPQKRKVTERLPRLLRTMRLVTPKLP